MRIFGLEVCRGDRLLRIIVVLRGLLSLDGRALLMQRIFSSREFLPVCSFGAEGHRDLLALDLEVRLEGFIVVDPAGVVELG